MNLEPKASAGWPRRGRSADAGYAMAALLVGLSVMAIMLSVAMPTWSHMIRREKEEELIFRGTQYARAINKYQQQYANASPASLDVLIEQRLLRKKFRDPLSPNKDGEFQLLYLNSQGTGARGGGVGTGVGARGAGAGGRGSAVGGAGSTTSGRAGGAQSTTTLSTTPSGGIVGVASKNTAQSIRTYKDKDHYNEWEFIGMEQSTQAGAGAAGGAAGVTGGGPQRGGRGGREGGGFGGAGSRGAGRGASGGRGNQGGFGGPGSDGGFGGRGPSPSPQR